MKVRDALDLIRFNTATTNDLSGKSSNKLFNNKNTVQQLKFALDKYAQYTKAIEAVFSFPLLTTTRTVDAPPDIIRSEGYRYIMVWIQGRKYSQDIQNFNRTQTEYPYDTYTDIPRWQVPWENELYTYPRNLNNFTTTTLTKAVKATDTTINVANTEGFPPNVGRITINGEKIRYQNLTPTQFLNCQRGFENTVAADHEIGTEVQENNYTVFYYKKHFEIPVDDSDKIEESIANREMQVDDVHMEVITDYTAYKLLSKVDTQRAAVYKVNFDEWLVLAKQDIQKGRSDINKGAMIREPYDWENVYAYNVY